MTEWSFGELPKEYQRRRGSYEVKAFPALVDEGESVAIKLFDDEQQAQALHRQGVRKLLLINIPSPVNIYSRHCQIKPNWRCILIRLGKCNC
ncbi:MAG: DUF3418 domain-containing protein [Shewanella fodinae]|nr:DUF3418 domain-containing protein [Shewanella fodinae]